MMVGARDGEFAGVRVGGQDDQLTLQPAVAVDRYTPLLERAKSALRAAGRTAAMADSQPPPTDDRQTRVPFDAVGGPPDLPTALQRLDTVTGQLHRRLFLAQEPASMLAGVSAALAEVYAVRFEIGETLTHERLRRFQALEAGLTKLRRIHDPDLLLSRVCQAVVDCCGFGRVMLSRVDNSSWRPWKSFAVGDRRSERNFREWITAIPEIRLDHLLLESDMVRRRGAAIVLDAANDQRVNPELVEVSGLTSYVAAPLLPGDRVAGFLHADYLTGQVEPLDLDVLWAFAKAFDQIFSRAVLEQRLGQQRQQTKFALQSIADSLDRRGSAEVGFDSLDGAVGSAFQSARSPAGPGLSGFDALLTKRELEVLALMATGASNDRIADKLVISGGTVKTHVKKILRKLRAENRAGAIAQYLRLTMSGDG